MRLAAEEAVAEQACFAPESAAKLVVWLQAC